MPWPISVCLEITVTVLSGAMRRKKLGAVVGAGRMANWAKALFKGT